MKTILLLITPLFLILVFVTVLFFVAAVVTGFLFVRALQKYMRLKKTSVQQPPETEEGRLGRKE